MSRRPLVPCACGCGHLFRSRAKMPNKAGERRTRFATVACAARALRGKRSQWAKAARQANTRKRAARIREQVRAIFGELSDREVEIFHYAAKMEGRRMYVRFYRREEMTA